MSGKRLLPVEPSDKRGCEGACRPSLGRAVRRALAVLASVVLITGLAVSDEAPDASDPEPTGPSLATDLQAIESVRARVEAELSGIGAAADPTARTPILREIERTTNGSLQVVRQLSAEPEVIPEAPDAPDESTLSRLAELYEEIGADRARIRDLEVALEASREARSQSAQSAAEAESAARRLSRTPDAEPIEIALARDKATLASEKARLARLEEQQTGRVLDQLSRRLPLIERRASELRERVRRQAGEVDAGRFADRGAALRQRLQGTTRNRASLELQVEAASERYRTRGDQQPDLLATVEALRSARDLAATRETVLRARLERLETQERLWSRWHRVVTESATNDEVSSWLDEAAETLRALQRERAKSLGRLASLRESIDAVRRTLAAPTLSPERREAAKRRSAALTETETATLEEVVELDQTIQLASRVQADATDVLGSISIGERLRLVGASIASIFAVRLTSVDDQPITVGKLLAAFLILVVGVVVSARASRIVGRVLERRGRLEPGVAGAFQTGLFYLLLIAFTLFALNLVNFPLTAFTVAGGALAIGIGFGSQNVLNNFISGLILMFERPVRSHDLVEIEGTHGTVERIGLRSTRIRAQDGRHIVVPNSFFLESNVVNWTLSDELIRTRLVVGVVYGSDTAGVRELLSRVLEENRRVLGEPPPLINFADFGESSLDFHVFFWTRTRTPMGMQIVMSELRYEIDRLFREADIVIAFPQRDVHLDSVKPVQISIVEQEAGSTPGSHREETR